MHASDDLIHEASALADAIRRRRADPRAYGGRDSAEIATMTAQLTNLWARIRANRVPPMDEPAPDFSRRTRPKWD